MANNMRFDPFIVKFGLPISQQIKLEKYQTPNMRSLVKGVPLLELLELKQICRTATGQAVRVIYRGPRKSSAYATRRADAKSASIYLK